MLKTEEEEKETLTDKRRGDEILDIAGMTAEKKKKKKKKKGKKKKKEEIKEEVDEDKEHKKKNQNQENIFNILGRYNLIKMLGFGSFGEIHLAYDNQLRCLCAIKFELSSQKNPQLKHEYNILEHLNKSENNSQGSNIIQEGVPKAYNFEQIEGKCNLMIMEFLGPSLADLFNYRKKQFSFDSVYMLGLQMIQRIELMHEKGFLHRDIKPENFVVGLNEKSNLVYIIDFGLSRRYKDKNTGQHIPYRENRHLVGTARYASINAHLGIEQSRRDDIESIGYVLVYFALGRLPWQSKSEKGKTPVKILEKKLVTPPEVLCRKLPGIKYIK
jgi:serine/threonine protein kinase